MTDHFLSCDWGTSSFRLRLISTADLAIIGEENSNTGIAATYTEWNKNEGSDTRQAHYFNVIATHIAKLEGKLGISFKNIPIVLSGMASSTIGIVELPYKQVPFDIAGTDISTITVKASDTFSHDVLIVSGVCTENDVMRGEETQLIGCADEYPDLKGQHTFIFPGTHSKHIFIEDGQVVSFTTYMTGEFFALLSKQSILQNAVKAHDGNGQPSESFNKGVKDAVGNNLLHVAFMVRTNDLFKKYTKEENYDYLSGLLIGTELQSLKSTTQNVYLCCGGNLEKYYSAALNVLGLDKVNVLPSRIVDASVIKGQFKILVSQIK